jgi:hypothetical protein
MLAVALGRGGGHDSFRVYRLRSLLGHVGNSPALPGVTGVIAGGIPAIADEGLWHVRHCSLACLGHRSAGKRLDQFGRYLARMPLVINPLRRLGARKGGLAR